MNGTNVQTKENVSEKEKTNPKCNMYEIITKKRNGCELSPEEILFFVKGYVGGEIPDYQASALLMAIYFQGMNKQELTCLTQNMLASGDSISLDGIRGKKIDKHSTGGVGDKISFIVSPLVAACGIYVPMLSGRSLGHTGGTLDKLESIPNFDVFLTADQFQSILNDVGMVICGQTENIVPADRKLYALRDATATVESIPLITASIMSKKLAIGTDGIVLDVKTGSGAFMRREEDSVTLCKTMVEVGEESGRTTIGLITDMDQPLGNAVGNSLEIIESIEALKGSGPIDLMTVTFGLGAAMLMAAGAADDFWKAHKKLKQVLASGKPLEIFKKFIAAHGGDPAICDNYSLLPQSKYILDFCAPGSGIISKINAYEVGMTAVDIGAGRRKKEDAIDHSAGFVFRKKVGDLVKAGDPILTLYTNRNETIPDAMARLEKATEISKQKIIKRPLIHYLIDKDGIHPTRV